MLLGFCILLTVEGLPKVRKNRELEGQCPLIGVLSKLKI